MTEEEKTPEEIEAEQKTQDEVKKAAEEKVKIEDRARIQGWIPLSEFKGDPAKHTSAEDFVKRADEMMPIMKAQLGKYETKIFDLEKSLKEQKETTKKIIKVQGKYSEDFYDSKLEEIKIQKRQAVAEQDTELYDKLDKQESKLVKPEPITIDDDFGEHPDITKWKQDNSWYGKDTELTEYAEFVADKLAKKGHNLTPYEFGQEIKKTVEKTFPAKFKNPDSAAGSGVDEAVTRGTTTTTLKKGKDWNSLPKDAKEAYMEIKASMPGYTKEKYLKDYYEGE